MSFIAILLTLFVGLFILIGSICGIYTKNNKKLTDFSISIAFGVLIGLSILEILPEAFGILNEQLGVFRGICSLIVLILIGIIILKILDIFVPFHEHEQHHNHKHKSEECHNSHLHHIGIVSSIAIMIHNIIEGMSLYIITKGNIVSGILLFFGIGLHNIPMGLVISSTLISSKYSKKKVLNLSLIVSISTFIGGLIMLILGGINELAEGILLSLTLGMTIYISIFELLHQIYHSKDKKICKTGIVMGLILLLISLLISNVVVQ